MIRSKALLFWVLMVAGLGVLAWRQVRQEQQPDPFAKRALLPGFERARARAIRIEYLNRDLYLRLERVDQGQWSLVDPLRYPAEPAMVEQLLSAFATNQAERVVDGTKAQLGLAPPNAVLEVFEDVGDKLVERRVEIGAIEVDQTNVIVAVDGVVWRTPRNLINVLDHNLVDWRDQSVWRFPADQVVAVRRSGSFRLDNKDIALDFTAEYTDRWRSGFPQRVSLSAERVGDWVIALVSARASDFLDEPLMSLAQMGLDPAPVRIEVELENGDLSALRLAPTDLGGTWLAAREGYPQVFRLSGESTAGMLRESHTMYAQEVVRVHRPKVTAMRMVQGQKEARIVRDGMGWSVTESKDGLTLMGPEPADSASVEQILVQFEKAKVLEYQPSAEFESRPQRLEFWVEMDGQSTGGEFGQELHVADGGKGVLFRRSGDLLAGLVDPRLVDAVSQPAASLRSKDLHKERELELVRLHLEQGSKTREYQRSETGQWSRSGSQVPATDLEVLVDRLIFMRAQELSVYEKGLDLEPALTVELFAGTGSRIRYQLARPRSGPAAQKGWVRYESDRKRYAYVEGSILGELERLLAQ